MGYELTQRCKELVSKPYRSPKIRGIRGKKGADEEGVVRYSDRG
ncbi:MAG: hypothetical protein Q7R88_01815 [bacterium]|nr:hypothetical protein [bacterium]